MSTLAWKYALKLNFKMGCGRLAPPSFRRAKLAPDVATKFLKMENVVYPLAMDHVVESDSTRRRKSLNELSVQ